MEGVVVSPVATFFANSLVAQLILAVAVLELCTSPRFKKVKVPLAGSRFAWEPRILANFRFFINAKSILDQGYYATKRNAFRFMRTDGDLVVLPPRFLDELSSLPASVANPTDGNMHNLLGSHTGLDILLDTDLHFRLIRGRLTPNLSPVMKAMQDELQHSLSVDLPNDSDDWAMFNVYEGILMLIARTSARVFLGPSLCRSAGWLLITTQFTQNLFKLALVTRLMPVRFHSIFVRLLPQYWIGRNYLKKAKAFLIPKFQERLDALEDDTYQERFPDGDIDSGAMLGSLIREARGPERNAEYLSHMQVVLALASIHTVQVHIVNLLFDLVTYPELVDMVRDEVRAVYRQNDYHWDRHCYNRLDRLDSLMRESQRINPPSLLSFHRIMYQDFTLSDGTLLPNGVHICMATNAIQNDPEITADPQMFDPLRYYKLRQQSEQHHMHQFANADRNALNFGHGKHACPGRLFASLEMKLIITKLIMEYDFKMPTNMVRPTSKTAYEFCFPDREAKIALKKRRTSVPRVEPF